MELAFWRGIASLKTKYIWFYLDVFSSLLSEPEGHWLNVVFSGRRMTSGVPMHLLCKSSRHGRSPLLPHHPMAGHWCNTGLSCWLFSFIYCHLLEDAFVQFRRNTGFLNCYNHQLFQFAAPLHTFECTLPLEGARQVVSDGCRHITIESCPPLLMSAPPNQCGLMWRHTRSQKWYRKLTLVLISTLQSYPISGIEFSSCTIVTV